VEGRAEKFKFEDVLRMPKLRTNLLSVGKITDRGRVTFDDKKARVTDGRYKTILTAYRKNGLYFLREERCESSAEANVAKSACKVADIETWHRRMGHL